MSGIYKELSDESFAIEMMGDSLFLEGTGRVTKACVAPLKDRYEAWSRKLTPVIPRQGFLESISSMNEDNSIHTFLWNPSRADYEMRFRSALRRTRRRLLRAEDAVPGHAMPQPGQPPPQVFVVHGRSDDRLAETTDTLRKLDVGPVVLRLQPNQGRTIIEKFEEHARDAEYAVVLLTADDEGGLRGTPPEGLRLRARQNVVFELGFFFAKLGRERVCALLDHDVERPSDYQGVLYIELDDRGRWRIDLGRELRAAGLPVRLANLA